MISEILIEKCLILIEIDGFERLFKMLTHFLIIALVRIHLIALYLLDLQRTCTPV